MLNILKCTFPSCKVRLDASQARVPAIEAIRNATGKPVTVEDLAKFMLCGRHSHVARKEGVQTYSYAGTVALIERRVAERETARAHFLRLRAKTQMGKAIAKALADSSKPVSVGVKQGPAGWPTHTFVCGCEVRVRPGSVITSCPNHESCCGAEKRFLRDPDLPCWNCGAN